MKYRLRKFKRVGSSYLLGAALVLLIIVTAGTVWHANRHDNPTHVGKPVVGQNVTSSGSQILSVQQPTATGQSQSGPTNEAPVPPDFTVYYPANPPSGMSVDKSSITYSKDSFSFALQLDGQDQFFINEEPAGNNFSYQRLKVKLGSPNDINTALGNGVFGTIGSNFLTAVNTNKNTLIVINCQAVECGVPTENLIASLQINPNPTKIN